MLPQSASLSEQFSCIEIGRPVRKFSVLWNTKAVIILLPVRQVSCVEEFKLFSKSIRLVTWGEGKVRDSGTWRCRLECPAATCIALSCGSCSTARVHWRPTRNYTTELYENRLREFFPSSHVTYIYLNIFQYALNTKLASESCVERSGETMAAKYRGSGCTYITRERNGIWRFYLTNASLLYKHYLSGQSQIHRKICWKRSIIGTVKVWDCNSEEQGWMRTELNQLAACLY
jgi:hypothetical protein